MNYLRSWTPRLFSSLVLAESVLACHPFGSYAALGDSYASGDGAGSSRLLPDFDALCARFSDAYPVKIAERHDLSDAKFRNLACGGAFTTSVLQTQVPRIAESDLVTIQVGGNEIDFFILLNECIQQWRPVSTCETELTRSYRFVQSTSFFDRFDALVAGAKKSMKPGSRLLILGYARFFNDKSEQCDHVTFSRTNSTNYLTQELRKKMNDILMSLNEVIRGTAEGHGATYIDTDKVFEGHRFCEEGVIEPLPDASWFFSDNGRSRPWHNPSRGGHQQQIFPNPFKGFLNFTQTFHPTREGHQAIADEVLRIVQTRT